MPKQELPVHTSECCTPLIAEPIAEDEAAEMARVFKALGDPIRLRLLSLIGAHESGRQVGDGVCVCELTGAFAVTAPTISHHLKVLREAGLIDSQRRGTWVYYWIIPATLKRLTSVLALPETLVADAR
ncbi:ArsR/SmtB family transcription factor [Nonomuraea jabiensis]|uniref:ArsR family transcriptional regulator n=1 Tax=Nonomuraea jabiensis TaxID=882448 RepID=A0A7W9L9X7_9ACTN|nr:metalloregulator ArsR/SmtB family transcription factor [Nonomuraea jabiensis]MBB5775888.1 ArsR family transcriptional regulator [Nonomuraea jabiensis]